MTLAEDLEAEVPGQKIEFAVIGRGPWYSDGERREVDASKRGIVLSWEEARTLLDYEYDDGS